MAGVLIALAINAWWSRVQDRETEDKSLREIRASLANDLHDMRENIGYQQRAAASSDALRAHLRSGKPYLDTLDALFGHVLTETFSVRDEAAYETLKQRGMETITNDSLRVAVGRVYGVRYPTVIGGKERVTKYFFERIIPFYDANFQDIEPLRSATPVDYAKLAASTEYRALLDWSVYMHTLLVTAEGALAEDVSTLIALIDAELAGR